MTVAHGLSQPLDISHQLFRVPFYIVCGLFHVSRRNVHVEGALVGNVLVSHAVFLMRP